MTLWSRLNFNLLGVAALSAFIFVGCESDQTVNNAPASATPTPAPAVATPTPVAALSALYQGELYFTVTTAYDQSPENPSAWIPTLVDGVPPSVPLPSACLIPYGQAPGPGNAAALAHTCNFVIPEGQLYLSTVTLGMGSSDFVNCKFMKFYPYYYELNAGVPPAPAFTPAPTAVVPPWTIGTTVPGAICNGNSGGYFDPLAQGIPAAETNPVYLPVACYNGAAVSLVPGFPSNLSVLQETQRSQQLTTPAIPSAFSLHQASNRWVSNDTASIASRGVASAPEYLVNSMHGYTFQCFNQFDVLTYQVSIKIGVESDPVGTNAVHIPGWR